MYSEEFAEKNLSEFENYKIAKNGQSYILKHPYGCSRDICPLSVAFVVCLSHFHPFLQNYSANINLKHNTSLHKMDSSLFNEGPATFREENTKNRSTTLKYRLL